MKYFILFFLSTFFATAQNHSEFEHQFKLRNEYSLVIKNEKYGVINRNNEIVVPLIYDHIDRYLFKKYGYSVARKKDKSGIINLKGETIVPFVYTYISAAPWDFKHGYAVVTIYEGDPPKGKKGMINLKGEVIFPIVYDRIKYLNKGYSLIEQDKKQGIVSKKGHITVPLGTYDWINEQTENKGLISVSKDKKEGTIRLDGKVIHEPIYNNIDTDFETNFAVISKDEKYGIINKKRKIITPLIYDYIYEPEFD